MSTFYLIRHGQNDYLGRALAGRLPVELNAKGHQEANQLAQALKEKGITRIFSSTIRRAVQTAEPIAEALSLEIVIAEEFQEIDFGAWTGQEMARLDQDERWKSFNRYRSGTRIPGGELMLEVQARVVSRLEALRREFPNETMAVTSHGDPIKSAVAYYLGAPLDLFQRIEIDPASCSVLRLEDWGPQVLGVNLNLRA